LTLAVKCWIDGLLRRGGKMNKKELQAKKSELEAMSKDIDNQLNEIEEIERNEKVENNKIRLDILRSNKDLILSLFEHNRTSCSDENPDNGYSYVNGHSRCNKCHLMEILDEEYNNDFEVSFDIMINKIF
jgi:hypothetical protein